MFAPNRLGEVVKSVHRWPFTVVGLSLIFQHAWEMHLTILAVWLGPLTVVSTFVTLIYRLPRNEDRVVSSTVL